jgi:(E)-4-hydroxy-3-methylbut-2-enyl-diphosphate synthase
VIDRAERELADVKTPIKVAIMGCVVNGPGEAEGADIALCAGKGKALLYRDGKKIATVSADEMAQALLAEVRRAVESAGPKSR